MDTTVSALTLLQALANRTGTKDILDLLGRASLAPGDVGKVGILVSFASWPERVKCLTQWADASPIAADLERLGLAAWGDPALLNQIRPLSDVHRTSSTVRRIGRYYLVAMAAGRPARAGSPETAAFVDRLRVLLLLRALESTAAGVPRERHLNEVCVELRQALDAPRHMVWDWIGRLAEADGETLDEFVASVARLCERPPPQQSPNESEERKFLRELAAVLAGRRLSLGPDGTVGAPSVAPQYTLAVHDQGDASDDLLPTPELEEVHSVIYVRTEGDDGQTFAVADVDTERPAPAQRKAGNGLIFQTMEDSQYLRHSWHHLSDAEEQAFVARALQLQQSDDVRDRLGAAFVGIAVLASMPLSQVSRVRLQRTPSTDWSISLQSGHLHRLSPRSSKGRRASAESDGWLRPMSKDWQIALPQTTVAELGKLRKRSSATLADLWSTVEPGQSLEFWFNERFTAVDELTRLTGPVTGCVLGQRVFEASHDQAKTSLLSSSSRTAERSACMYGSFTVDEIRGTLGAAIRPQWGEIFRPAGVSSHNAGGSEMDVDVARLRAAVRALTKRVDAAASDGTQWVEHHNLLTALCVVALFASTGGRPVRSPFESLSWFDFDRRLIFVEDKRSGPTQGSRLCVLSDVARALMVDRYLPHLQTLEQALSSRLQKFAGQLGALRTGADCQLPLFFFLRTEPDFDWVEVSESQLDFVCERPWPLPWNLFRHLSSTQLRRWGLAAEVRDALLAHGERGAESHGEFSWRVPKEDLQVAAPLVNRLARELGLVVPRESAPPVLPVSKLTDIDLGTARHYGRKLRLIHREKSHAAAREMARMDIVRLLENRPPDSLSSEQWEQIARHMILRRDGAAHRMASLRFDVFEEYLAELWRGPSRIHTKVGRRYVPLGEPQAWFTEDVTAADGLLKHLRHALDAAATAISKPRPEVAGCLAALELALHCRVSNFSVLSSVVCNSAAVEAVRFDGRFWLECAYAEEWRDGRPVYRVPITERAAGWIGLRRTVRRHLSALPATPNALSDFGGIRSERFAELQRRVCDLVAEANALELPGVMAAVLSGARESSALPHSDWVRTVHLEAIPVAPSIDDESREPEAKHFLLGQDLNDGDRTSARTRCAKLLDDIQVVLDQASKVTARAMSTQVSELVKASGFPRGSAPFVLGHYVYHLLTRPNKKDKANTLKVETARRYWYALKAGFLAHAFDVDLPSLDEEDLTELYQDVVDEAEKPTDRGANRKKLKDDSDTGHRTLKELLSFHEFARDVYGLDDPDWSEISPSLRAGAGRPGIVLMAEYEAVLAAMVNESIIDTLDDPSLASAFVLLACARFGLRLGEAVGLQYADWVEIAGSVVVLVRSSSIRGLKTVASKRQVPLVGRLSSLERAVVDESRRRWLLNADPRARLGGLIAAVTSDSYRSQKGKISRQLLPLIKAVTGNPQSTIHHLRHGFVCRLLTLLHGQPCGAGLPCDKASSDDARRLLLQTTRPDRRTMWALARAVGHSSPTTTIKSYLHVLDSWLPHPPARHTLVPLELGFPYVNLDALRRTCLIDKLEHIPVRNESPYASLFTRNMHYLRLRANGNREAGIVARLSQAESQRLDAAIESVARRVMNHASVHAGARLLAKIDGTRWHPLLARMSGSTSQTPPLLHSAWLPTVSARERRLVLFLPEHFNCLRLFLDTLGLSEEDCHLIHADDARPGLLSDARARSLEDLLCPVSRAGESFKLDVALDEFDREHRQRMVVRYVRGGQLASGYELVLLWAAWLAHLTPPSETQA